MYGECLQCLNHTGWRPLAVCLLLQPTLLRLQVALQWTCLKWALDCMHLPDLSHSVQVLRYSTKAQIQLALCFVPFPGLSISGDHMLGECTLPRHSTSYCLPGPNRWTSWVAAGMSSEVCHVSFQGSWSLATTILMDINRPESQQVLVSYWKPACSL